MTKLIKLIAIAITLLPCILLAQENSGIISSSLKSKEEKVIKSAETISNRNEELKKFVEQVSDNNKTDQTSNETKSSTISEENNSNPTSLLDKIQSGLGNVLLGNEKISSLMFDEKENEDINKAVDSFKTGQLYSPNGSQKPGEEIDPNRKSYAFLGSIMYIDKNYWAVWINNKKITSEENNRSAEIYVNSISKDKASITWSMSPTKWKILLGLNSDNEVVVNSNNQVVTKFELHPNQSFLLASSSVIEGNPENNLTNKLTNPSNLNQPQ